MPCFNEKKQFIKILRENNIVNIDDAMKCDELWDIDNAITLCKSCHNKTKRGNQRGSL
jgi:5-methylcytosine-specific restriction endonuclease McrA